MSTLPLNTPKFRAFDANGDPLAGGLLYSYAAGTSTPLDTYTTRAGTIANTNPVVLDANGEADVWTTPGLLYKFVLADALDVIQWTVDNVPSSGSTDSASSEAAAAINPGGRLSVASGNSAPEGDITSAATVFYVEYLHNKVPLYDGSAWTLRAFASQLTQALSDTTKSPGAAVANTTYDLFVWDDAGTLRLSRGPAWASGTSRGSGAGTTDLERVGARNVNRYAISNGPGAQRGLYVGSVHVGASGVSDGMAFRHVWNAYNRVQRPMRVSDGTASWAYSTDVWRYANNNGSNKLDLLIGLPGVAARAEVLSVVKHAVPVLTGVTTARLHVGIGVDSGTVNGASLSTSLISVAIATVDVNEYKHHLLTATYDGFPGLGHHTIGWLERAFFDPVDGSPGELTWYGQGGALLANSGIIGHLMA